MNERIEFEEHAEERKNLLGGLIMDNVRKAYLAGWGAAVYTTDFIHNEFNNVTELTGKLVAKGEEAEKKTRKTVAKEAAARQKTWKKRAKSLEKEADKRVAALLHTINVPTRSDIDKLNRRVARLNKQLEELNKAA